MLNFSKVTNSNIKQGQNYIIILVKNSILVKNKYKCTFHSSHECLTYFYKLHNIYFDMFIFIVFIFTFIITLLPFISYSTYYPLTIQLFTAILHK